MSDNSKSEVAESCLEYLLAEILALDPQMKPNQSEVKILYHNEESHLVGRRAALDIPG